MKYASAVLRQVSQGLQRRLWRGGSGRVDQDISGLKPDVPKVWQFTVQYKGKPSSWRSGP